MKQFVDSLSTTTPVLLLSAGSFEKKAKKSVVVPTIEIDGDITPAHIELATDFLSTEENLEHINCPCCTNPLNFRLTIRKETDFDPKNKVEVLMSTCLDCMVGTRLAVFIAHTPAMLPLSVAQAILVLEHREDESPFVDKLKQNSDTHAFYEAISHMHTSLPKISAPDKILGAQIFLREYKFSLPDAEKLALKYFGE